MKSKVMDMSDQKDDLAQLLRVAGHRPTPPEEALKRMRTHVHGEWQAMLARRRRRQIFAVAASVLLAVGVSVPLLLRVPGTPPVAIAQLQGAAPDLGIVRGTRAARQFAADRFAAGDELRTGAHAIALTRTDDPRGVLRLAAGSRLRWTDSTHVDLLQGRLYVDTGATRPTSTAGATHGVTPAASLIVQAGEARIEHVGTQFLAERTNSGGTVSVREGRVRIDLAGTRAELGRGEAASFSDRGASLERTRSGADEDTWAWAEALAPHLALEGRDLRAVLAELAYEHGQSLRFARPEVETQVSQTVLHGPPLQLAPAEAMRTLLATAGFSATTGDGGSELVIDQR
jgi:hypothetical protein